PTSPCPRRTSGATEEEPSAGGRALNRVATPALRSPYPSASDYRGVLSDPPGEPGWRRAGDGNAAHVDALQMAPGTRRDDVVRVVGAALRAEAHVVRRPGTERARGVRATKAVARIDVRVSDGRQFANPRFDEHPTRKLEKPEGRSPMTEIEGLHAAIERT